MITLIEFAFQVNDFVHMKMEKVFIGARKLGDESISQVVK